MLRNFYIYQYPLIYWNYRSHRLAVKWTIMKELYTIEKFQYIEGWTLNVLRRLILQSSRLVRQEFRFLRWIHRKFGFMKNKISVKKWEIFEKSVGKKVVQHLMVYGWYFLNSHKKEPTPKLIFKGTKWCSWQLEAPYRGDEDTVKSLWYATLCEI